jgi:hypothetical protein
MTDETEARNIIRDRMKTNRENTERLRGERELAAQAHVGSGVRLRNEQDASLDPKPVEAGPLLKKLLGHETLPTDSAERKGIPIVTGLLDYFPAALAEVAKVSKAGNDKHNPGEALHWARGKSMDQEDCIGRHLMERGGFDPETGQRHTAQMAWRALALLQLELEAAGAPMARAARG